MAVVVDRGIMLSGDLRYGRSGMHCPFCGTEKEPGSWLCPNCSTLIRQPRKPPYEAGGWEWIAAIVCIPLFALLYEEGFFVLVAGPAFAFSAARDRRSVPKALGILCLIFWATPFLAMGWPLLALLGYFAFILTFEHVRWRRKLARM